MEGRKTKKFDNQEFLFGQLSKFTSITTSLEEYYAAIFYLARYLETKYEEPSSAEVARRLRNGIVHAYFNLDSKALDDCIKRIVSNEGSLVDIEKTDLYQRLEPYVVGIKHETEPGPTVYANRFNSMLGGPASYYDDAFAITAKMANVYETEIINDASSLIQILNSGQHSAFTYPAALGCLGILGEAHQQIKGKEMPNLTWLNATNPYYAHYWGYTSREDRIRIFHLNHEKGVPTLKWIRKEREKIISSLVAMMTYRSQLQQGSVLSSGRGIEIGAEQQEAGQTSTISPSLLTPEEREIEEHEAEEGEKQDKIVEQISVPEIKVEAQAIKPENEKRKSPEGAEEEGKESKEDAKKQEQLLPTASLKDIVTSTAKEKSTSKKLRKYPVSGDEVENEPQKGAENMINQHKPN